MMARINWNYIHVPFKRGLQLQKGNKQDPETGPSELRTLEPDICDQPDKTDSINYELDTGGSLGLLQV
jgi:hypothetical protein